MEVEIGPIQGANCIETIRVLEKIGIRVAGTAGEKAAADWIAGELEKLGLVNVRQQEFPCLSFGHSICEVELTSGDGWTSIDCEPAAHSPSKPGTELEGDFILIEKVPESSERTKAKMNGRVVLIYGSQLMQLENFQKIMKAGPLALLVVEDRVPGDWTVAIGFPRYWVDFLTCPVLNISYMDAWNAVKNRVTSVRIRLDAYVKEATSQNVIGEMKGSEFPDEVVVVTGHHDSVANNPGLDDNCTGVAALLELARVFKNPRRTLRFVSFGAEEQLSEGARHYASKAQDIENIQLQLNTDSIGAWMGTTGIYCTGPLRLAELIEEVNLETDFPGHVTRELSPFSDHFPLNLCGVPAVWYYRQTYTAARHYHHSPLETIDVISPDVLERTIRQQTVLLKRFVDSEKLPSPREISGEQAAELKKMAKEWVGVDTLR